MLTIIPTCHKHQIWSWERDFCHYKRCDVWLGVKLLAGICWSSWYISLHWLNLQRKGGWRRVEGVAEGRTSVSQTCSTSVISASLIHFRSTQATGFSSRHTPAESSTSTSFTPPTSESKRASASTCCGRDGIREANRNCNSAQRCYLICEYLILNSLWITYSFQGNHSIISHWSSHLISHLTGGYLNSAFSAF